MKLAGTHNYYTYILTNKNKTVLYTGVTNNLSIRLSQHRQSKESFTSKYKCYHLIYYERFESIEFAIRREKEIKGWRRSKKTELINSENPEWKFLEDELDH